jgi:hypothetical protein
MASITFTSGTVIPSTWLNDVNTITYTTVPSHTTSIATITANNWVTTSRIADANVTYAKLASDVLSAFPGRLIGIQILTGSGTYTPTTGTNSIIVRGTGGGGGSGGTSATSSTQYSIAISGGGGSTAEARFTSSFSGVSYSVGTGGTAGPAGSGTGGDGGSTTFGALLTIPGGKGASYTVAVTSTASTVTGIAAGGAAPTGANILAIPGSPSSPAWTTGGLGFTSTPGTSRYGVPPAVTNVVGAAVDSTITLNGYGVGGKGAFAGISTAALVGSKGSDGILIVYEFA